MDSKTFQIPAMAPEDVDVIQAELEQIDGVRMVQIHEPTQSVTVTWTSLATWDDIGRRLAEMQLTPDLPQGY